MAAADLSRGSAKCSSGITVEIESESDKRTGGRACFRGSEPHLDFSSNGLTCYRNWVTASTPKEIFFSW
jgi:hypothetical protein